MVAIKNNTKLKSLYTKGYKYSVKFTNNVN